MNFSTQDMILLMVSAVVALVVGFYMADIIGQVAETSGQFLIDSVNTIIDSATPQP